MLEDGKYDSDPMRAWKESIEKVNNNIENFKMTCVNWNHFSLLVAASSSYFKR